MDFIVKLPDGSHKGPIDQETLRKWVEIDKVLPDTPVRNAILSAWKEARNFEFLDDAFAEQALRHADEAEQRKGLLRKLMDRVLSDFKRANVQKEVSSAFKYEYLPNPAKATLRIGAAIIDWGLIALLAVVLLGFGMSSVYIKSLSATAFIDKPKAEELATAKGASTAAPKAEEAKAPVETIESYTGKGLPSNLADSSKGFKRGSVWTDSDTDEKYACISDKEGEALWCERNYINVKFHFIFAIFTVATLAYLGFSLGFFAQTLGMWYFGIFIVKNDGSPAFPLRTFIFALLSIPLGFLTILVSFIMPDRRSIHDIITGTKLIGIAAKPKA